MHLLYIITLMPSVKLNYMNEHTNDYNNYYNEEKELTLEDYLNDEDSKNKLIIEHYNTFSFKYEEAIKSIYTKYYNKYKKTGFLEKDEMGYVDIFNILYDYVKIKYNLEIFKN